MALRQGRLKRYRTILYASFLVASVIYIYHRVESERILKERAVIMRRIFEIREEQDDFGNVNKTALSQQTCVLPSLPLWNEQLFYAFADPCKSVTCHAEDNWIYTENGRFYISHNALQKYGNIDCSYIPIVCENDNIKYLTKILNVQSGDQLVSDAFKVTCKSKLGYRYSNTHACISVKEDLDRFKVNQKGDEMPYNVLFVGLDSMSKQAYKRFMPKTHAFFVKELGGYVLEGYNIVGDGTTQALMPILTGLNETEVPEVRRGHRDAVHVDEAAEFIWKRFERHGYRTLWAEDSQKFATFHYRLLGFKTQPVHHYMRPFQLEIADYDRFACLGSKTTFQVYLDWISEAMHTSRYLGKPLFAFSHNSDITHNDNSCAANAENDTLKFLKKFKQSGFTDDSFLFLTSDHGLRTGPARESEQGKLEERMPYFGVFVPEKFRSKYPTKYKTFLENIYRLTTPFDIYQTLLDILDDRTNAASVPYRKTYSLFTPIPLERTCDDAGVERHWCACLKWQIVSVSDDSAIKTANAAVNIFNGYLNKTNSACLPLNLKRLVSAKKLETNNKLLKFKQSVDMDGRVIDMSDKIENRKQFYQITIETNPGGGLFEVTASIDVLTGKMHFDKRDISRINLYGDAPKCIIDKYPELRPFCFCR